MIGDFDGKARIIHVSIGLVRPLSKTVRSNYTHNRPYLAFVYDNYNKFAMYKHSISLWGLSHNKRLGRQGFNIMKRQSKAEEALRSQ